MRPVPSPPHPATRLPRHPTLNRQRSAPGVLALERLIEVEYLDKLISRVGGLAHEQAQIDKREYDVSNISAAVDAPMIEDDPRHDPKALQGQVAARQGELPAIDVPSLLESLLAELEGGEHE